MTELTIDPRAGIPFLDWRKVHSKPVQEFIDKYGGVAITPDNFKEILEFTNTHLNYEERFEFLFWQLSQCRKI